MTDGPGNKEKPIPESTEPTPGQMLTDQLVKIGHTIDKKKDKKRFFTIAQKEQVWEKSKDKQWTN